MLVPFGTHAWVKDVKAGKLDRRSKHGRFVGFDLETRGYRIFFANERRVAVEREVLFDRERSLKDEAVEIEMDEPLKTIEPPKTPDEKQEDHNIPQDLEVNEPEDAPTKPRSPKTKVVPRTVDGLIEADPTKGRGMRARPAAGHFKNVNEGHVSARLASEDNDEPFGIEFAYLALPGDEPVSVDEAIGGPDGHEWVPAIKAELDVLEQHDTWRLVQRPQDQPVIPCHFIFRTKRGPDGEIVKRKARLVAGGHKQIKGVNYDETFAAAAKINSIRLVLAIAAQLDWEIHQVDVVGAYLNAELDDEIYMEPPHGIVKPEDGDLVCRLQKGLYGLKQSTRKWYQRLCSDLGEMGFKPSMIDASVFYRDAHDGKILMPVSTDDMVVAGTTIETIDRFKGELKNRYRVTDLGEIRWLLGFEIRRDRAKRTIAINQAAYLKNVAEKFCVGDAKPLHIPMEPGLVLTDDDDSEATNAPYREACGSVLWAAILTRPDVQFSIGILAQHTQKPTEAAWKALKRVIRYLDTTRNHWLTLGGIDKSIRGFTDSDWGSQPHRHSISGYAFLVGTGAVTWRSKKQSTVAQSTAEAEYVAMADATKEALWIRHMLSEVHPESSLIVPIHCDNQSALAIAKDNKFHQRTKHIAIRHHFIRDTVRDNEISIHYIPTTDNIADILTKALPRPQFEYLRNGLGLRPA
jgi:hypothetical protein